MKSRVALVAAASLAMFASQSAVADDPVDVIAAGTIAYPSSILGVPPIAKEHAFRTDPYDGPGGNSDADGPLPLNMSRPGRWQSPFSLTDDRFGMFAFANANGRVRTSVTSGDETEQSPHGNEFGDVFLVWAGEFTRTSAENPSFTLNPSHLLVQARQRGPQLLFGREGTWKNEESDQAVLPLPPYARMHFAVKVQKLTHHSPGIVLFRHRSRIEGIGDLGTRSDCAEPVTSPATAAAPFRLDYATFESDGFILDRDGEVLHDVPNRCTITHDAGVCYSILGHQACFGERETSIRYDIGPYTQEINLSAHGIGPGDRYMIIYVLEVEAGEDDAEQFVEAALGDPLDSDSGGLTLSTSDTPAEGSGQICGATGDSERYRVHGDGTVTDAHTGLMWQRCPAGTAYDDAGTATADDDRCRPDGTTTLPWQDALASSDGQDTGSYTDWRLPNVKELQSLVAPHCLFAAIDRQAFPDTPWRAFWSSTPRLDPSVETAAYTVEFSEGSVSTLSVDQPAFRRYVRDTQEPPVIRPAIRAGRAEVVEGDPGNDRQMIFPVWLSSVIDQDVQVDATVEAIDAGENIDFQPVELRLVIPAGQKRTSVAVTVVGDLVPEPPESVRLSLGSASPNAYIASGTATGLIVDNEPFVRFEVVSSEVLEGESDNGIPRLRLNKPAADVVTVDYATRPSSPESADAGDYTFGQGTAVFNVGEQTAEISIPITDDGIAENDERFEIVLSNPFGATLLADDAVASVRIVDDDRPQSLGGLNDSALRVCSAETLAELACPQPGFPLQDAEVGRDVWFPDNGDGGLGFSFTKIDANGDELPFSSVNYSCLRDNVTGMMWEIKNNDSSSLHYQNSVYSWRNTSGVDDGGEPGTANGGQCAGSDCDTEAFVAAVNASALCGYSDWRLPTAHEAFDLASFDRGNGTTASRGLDRELSFNGRLYWTATPFVGENEAWFVEYGVDSGPEARLQLQPKSTPIFLRLVRSELGGS